MTCGHWRPDRWSGKYHITNGSVASLVYLGEKRWPTMKSKGEWNSYWEAGGSTGITYNWQQDVKASSQMAPGKTLQGIMDTMTNMEIGEVQFRRPEGDETHQGRCDLSSWGQAVMSVASRMWDEPKSSSSPIPPTVNSFFTTMKTDSSQASYKFVRLFCS